MVKLAFPQNTPTYHDTKVNTSTITIEKALNYLDAFWMPLTVSEATSYLSGLWESANILFLYRHYFPEEFNGSKPLNLALFDSEESE
jgi:hypothetical protein